MDPAPKTLHYVKENSVSEALRPRLPRIATHALQVLTHITVAPLVAVRQTRPAPESYSNHFPKRTRRDNGPLSVQSNLRVLPKRRARGFSG